MPDFSHSDLFDLLETQADRFNQSSFIETDPISIPHRYSTKADIEIAGLFAAVFAWGQRPTILAKCNRLMQWMDDAPAQFVRQYQTKDLERFKGFAHRTFNEGDLVFFLKILREIYADSDLESVFAGAITPEDPDVSNGLIALYDRFFDRPDANAHSRKHLPDIRRKSAGKRLNMYLRWMVRRDKRGVDFGLWQSIKPAQLLCPLDVHVGRTARLLGLLQRPTDDWAAVLELTEKLRGFDPNDPVRYDFALYGLSMSKTLKEFI